MRLVRLVRLVHRFRKLPLETSLRRFYGNTGLLGLSGLSAKQAVHPYRMVRMAGTEKRFGLRLSLPPSPAFHFTNLRCAAEQGYKGSMVKGIKNRVFYFVKQPCAPNITTCGLLVKIGRVLMLLQLLTSRKLWCNG